jgi:hypothetical protein
MSLRISLICVFEMKEAPVEDGANERWQWKLKVEKWGQIRKIALEGFDGGNQLTARADINLLRTESCPFNFTLDRIVVVLD